MKTQLGFPPPRPVSEWRLHPGAAACPSAATSTAEPPPGYPESERASESAGHSGLKAEAEKRETSEKVSPRGARSRPRSASLNVASWSPGRGRWVSRDGAREGWGEGRAAADSGAATWPGSLSASWALHSTPRPAPRVPDRHPAPWICVPDPYPEPLIHISNLHPSACPAPVR